MENPDHTNPNLPSNLNWAKHGAFYLKKKFSANGLVLLVQLNRKVAHLSWGGGW